MLQGFFRRDTLLGIVDEYPPEEVEELPVEVGVSRNGFLLLLGSLEMAREGTYVKLLHRLDVFLGCLVGIRVGVVQQFGALEILCSTVDVSSAGREHNG
jgi:hypothetical protein